MTYTTNGTPQSLPPQRLTPGPASTPVNGDGTWLAHNDSAPSPLAGQVAQDGLIAATGRLR
ncbi:MAG TPA: hypothetical protein VF821_23275, partial [Lentzea sp.]